MQIWPHYLHIIPPGTSHALCGTMLASPSVLTWLEAVELEELGALAEPCPACMAVAEAQGVGEAVPPEPGSHDNCGPCWARNRVGKASSAA